MRSFLFLTVLAVILAGCSNTSTDASRPDAAPAPAVGRQAQVSLPVARSHSFASLPDKGDLLGYPANRVMRHATPHTWHRVDISETHAVRAIVKGEMSMTAPDGQPIRLRYLRHIEHPNGNWTWVGRDAHGGDAIITFGEKAVFGSISRGRTQLRLTMIAGRSWLVEIDPEGLDPQGPRPDYLVPPELIAALAETVSSPMTAAASTQPTSAASAPTVDVALGYTTGLAASLGGNSQAVTRLQNLVDTTNQAYANSRIDARVRLVRTLAVSYPDATDNGDALEKLTGYKSGSGSISVDPAFNALRAARDQYGADLVSLVRDFKTPQNDGCGIAWLIGGDQSGINGSDAPFGYSVVSDGSDLDEGDNKTYFCRDETLAHEIGHNLGQAHNTEDAGGSSGAHAYSYGYREGSTSGFYTVMAYRVSGSSQYPIRYFANPAVDDAASGRPTGIANVADNVRSMLQTMPIVANFRSTIVPVPAQAPSLYAIEKQSASLKTKLNLLSGSADYGSFLLQTPTKLGQTGTGSDWKFRVGDYNGDAVLDLYSIKKMGASGYTEVHIWNAADQFQSSIISVATALGRTGTDEAWVFDLGHYNSDGKLDLYAIKRQGASGMTEVHVLSGADNFKSFLLHTSTALGNTGTDFAWRFEVGDLNGDGKQDLYCVKKVGTGGRTEVHVLDGSNAFKSFLLHKATALGQTGTTNGWDFKLGDLNGDYRLDLYAIKKQGTSGMTEVHVLNGADNFQTYLLHKATALASTGNDGSWDFDLAGP